jgi:hypothetical protein
MSIDDLTLTDLTIVKTQMLRLKFIVTVGVCGQVCMWISLYMVHE